MNQLVVLKDQLLFIVEFQEEAELLRDAFAKVREHIEDFPKVVIVRLGNVQVTDARTLDEVPR